MNIDAPIDMSGKRGLILGIANEASIGYGCARVMQAGGAELAITYQNEKAEPHVRPLAKALGVSRCLPCDVRAPGQLEAVFAAVGKAWGGSTSSSIPLPAPSRPDDRTRV